MKWHHFPTPRHRQAFYERWMAVLAFLILGEVGIAYQISDARIANSQLATAGPPVGAILVGASIIGILVSLVIFRTPHDGQTEL